MSYFSAEIFFNLYLKHNSIFYILEDLRLFLLFVKTTVNYVQISFIYRKSFIKNTKDQLPLVYLWSSLLFLTTSLNHLSEKKNCMDCFFVFAVHLNTLSLSASSVSMATGVIQHYFFLLLPDGTP